MRRLFLVATALAATALSFATQAANLYVGSVDVANRGAGERARALPLAFKQVLAKVSGDSGLAKDAAVGDHIGRASEILMQVSYRDEAAPVPAGSNAGGLTLLAEFDPANVDAILRELGRPVWKVDRPRLLVWLVIESGAARQVASANQTSALGALLKQAERRGFDIVLPTWDYTDQGRASIESLWLGDMRAVRAASGRYGTQAVVLARLRRTADGWNSRYTLIDIKRSESKGEEWLAIHPNASDALADAIEGSADRLARRFATSPEDLLNASYSVGVANVRSGSDYGRVVAYLKGLHVVRAAEPVGAEGDRLLLRLDLSVKPGRFATVLAGDNVIDAVRIPTVEAGELAYPVTAVPAGDGVLGAEDGNAEQPTEAMPLFAESLPELELSLRR